MESLSLTKEELKNMDKYLLEIEFKITNFKSNKI